MRESLPYEASIDYLLTRRPQFFDELHQKLFEDYKKQWIEALPIFPSDKLSSVIKNLQANLDNPAQKAHHPWSEWLMKKINDEYL